MDWFARELGYGDQAQFWATAGLLHDLDFEQYPEEHCVKVREIMEEKGLDPALIHAVVSHGWGMTKADVQPEHQMEKVLFAVDELTGLIGAAALMRPSKSVQDMELSSLKKKYKDKRFAAGCSRETIARGAQLLGWELSDLLERTLNAMKAKEAAFAIYMIIAGVLCMAWLILGYKEEGMLAAMSICLLVILYTIMFRILAKKY